MTNHVSSRDVSDDEDDDKDSETRNQTAPMRWDQKNSRTEFDRLANACSPSGYPRRVMDVPCAAGPARRAPTNGARAAAPSPGFSLHTGHSQSVCNVKGIEI